MLFLREIGEEKPAVRQLLGALKSGRIAHAYLFTGPEEAGKEAAGQAFARALNCEQPVQGDACGVCMSCRKAAEGNHPDVFNVLPQGSHIKIEQMRELQRTVSYRRYEGRYRVALIFEADLMTEAAANSILKLLEEPPENTVFVLATNRPAAILPTILSRCVELRFELASPLAAPSVPTGRETTGGKSGGSLDQPAAGPTAGAAREQALNYLEQLAQADQSLVLVLAAEMEKRDDLGMILDWMVRWCRDLIVWQQLRSETLILNRDQMDRVRSLQVPGGDPVAAVQEILRTKRRLQDNVNARLSLETLFLRLLPGGAARGGVRYY